MAPHPDYAEPFFILHCPFYIPFLIFVAPKRDVAQSGSVLAWGARGRGFESRLPDHKNRPNRKVRRFFVFSPFGSLPDSAAGITPHPDYSNVRPKAVGKHNFVYSLPKCPRRWPDGNFRHASPTSPRRWSSRRGSIRCPRARHHVQNTVASQLGQARRREQHSPRNFGSPVGCSLSRRRLHPGGSVFKPFFFPDGNRLLDRVDDIAGRLE